MDVRGAQATASALAQARRAGTALAGFPGEVPTTLADAYRVQDAVIERRREPVRGWKVGGIAPELRAQLGAERLVGPVFAGGVRLADGRRLALPCIPGGTACVEAEIAVVARRDVPLRSRPWTLADARAYVGEIRLAVELAGSAVPAINAIGPLAVAADCGNNAGLVLGPRITDPPSAPWLDLACTTEVDGVVVGRGTPRGVEGGPLEAFRFALQALAARGRTLRAGDAVATGAITGIHDVVPGQRARVRFGDLLALDIDLVPTHRSDQPPTRTQDRER